jgi:hypothetical protein
LLIVLLVLVTGGFGFVCWVLWNERPPDVA